jgi:hypothetical protein
VCAFAPRPPCAAAEPPFALPSSHFFLFPFYFFLYLDTAGTVSGRGANPPGAGARPGRANHRPRPGSIPGTGNGTRRSCEQLTRRYRNVRSCFPCVHYIANASVMSRRLDIRLACDALAFLLQGLEPFDVARKFSAQAHALWTRARQCAPIGFRFLSSRQVSGDFNASRASLFRRGSP